MRTVTLLLGIATATATVASVPAVDATSVVGTWQLVSCKSEAADGTVRDLYGPKPAGQLIYDAHGHMSVHLLKPDLPMCGTLDRRQCANTAARAAFDNYFGYWGSYKLDTASGTVTHYIEGASVPDWVNTTQVRRFAVQGGRLTLTTSRTKVAGIDTVQTLTWERQ
jgi:Lipocalin-like domain